MDQVGPSYAGQPGLCDGSENSHRRDAGFWSCKVVRQSTGRVIGLLDVHIDAETYLSLLIIHRSYAHQGIGQHVYRALEAYARSYASRMIRVDVVMGYDDRVRDFWIRNGFQAVEHITLEWNGSKLPATTMKKALVPAEGGQRASR